MTMVCVTPYSESVTQTMTAWRAKQRDIWIRYREAGMKNAPLLREPLQGEQQLLVEKISDICRGCPIL